jgi:hypothetical protein
MAQLVYTQKADTACNHQSLVGGEVAASKLCAQATYQPWTLDPSKVRDMALVHEDIQRH